MIRAPQVIMTEKNSLRDMTPANLRSLYDLRDEDIARIRALAPFWAIVWKNSSEGSTSGSKGAPNMTSSLPIPRWSPASRRVR